MSDMKYKVLAFDLDGTLLNSEKKITHATKSAIEKAASLGCKIVLASGRPYQGIVNVAKELRLDKLGGYVLSLNGGKIISCADNSIIHDVKMDMSFYKEIYDLAKENNVNLMTYEGDDVISEKIDDKYIDIEARINGLGKKQVPNLLKQLTFEVNKFLMLGDGDYLAEVEKKVYDRLHDRLDVYRSEPFFLEILPKGINKAGALETLLKAVGATREELIAFGDGYNDLTMIQYAGLGVAMSNGNAIVKENADYIAPSNDEDGIVEVINKFVLDGNTLMC